MSSVMKGFRLGRRVLTTVMGETVRGGGRDMHKPPKDKFGRPNKASGRFPFQEKKKPPQDVMVHPDPDMTLLDSIMRKKEAGNNLSWVTGDSEAIFMKYSQARSNYRNAKNATKSGGSLKTYFERDPQAMAQDLQLKDQEYARFYMAYPGLKKPVLKVDKKVRVVAVRVDASRVVAGQVVTGRVVASRAVSGRVVVGHADAHRVVPVRVDDGRIAVGRVVSGSVIDIRVGADHVAAGRVVPGRVVSLRSHVEDAKKVVGGLMRNAALMVEDGGKIIVLHQDSLWGLKEVAAINGLKFDKRVAFNAELYPHFQPRWAETDEEFDPSGSAFYYFTV